jgi:thioredoxin 1
MTRPLRLFIAASLLSATLGPSPIRAQAAQRHLYYPTADAKAEIGRALEKAKSEKRFVMIVFGSDWCVDCWVLDTLLHYPAVEPIVRENYEIVKVDIGRWDLNLDVSNKYGNPIEKGVPAVVIVDAKGAMVASTKEKPWENARALKAEDIAAQLKAWASKPSPETSLLLTERTERDVAVSIRLVMKAASASLCGTFAPTRQGFHLYAIELPDEGINGIGRPTRLSVVKSNALRPQGAAKADRASTTVKVEPLGLTFPVYPAGPVTLCMPVEVADRRDASADIALSYMTCSDQVCMPPVARVVAVSFDPSSARRVRE